MEMSGQFHVPEAVLQGKNGGTSGVGDRAGLET